MEGNETAQDLLGRVWLLIAKGKKLFQLMQSDIDTSQLSLVLLVTTGFGCGNRELTMVGQQQRMLVHDV